MSSILNDTKHMIGLLPEDTAFDMTVVIHVNTAISDLTQLGVGPVQGYQITGPENQWDELVNDPRMNAVKSYVFLKVKLLFDPPQSGFAAQAIERQLTEMQYRINVVADYG